MNDLLLRALRCENEERPPVWLMRQAGRYQPEYRAIRAKHSFLEMVHNPELAAEVTWLPVNQLGVDAAILFSDILTVAEALGVGLRFEDKLGPVIERPLRTVKDVDALPDNPDPMEYVGDAIRLLTPELPVPLVGFAGAPFTVASYLIEGGSSRDLKRTKQWMLRDPDSFHRLLAKITKVTSAYLNMQVRAGVHALQLFDSWANCLSYSAFREFSLPYMEQTMNGVDDKSVPMILFCRGSSVFASDMAAITPSAISLDWNCDIGAVRRQVGPKVALQGNLDPFTLYAPRQVIQRHVNDLLSRMDGDPGYIFNLGHGVSPDMTVDAVKILVETVKCWKPSHQLSLS